MEHGVILRFEVAFVDQRNGQRISHHQRRRSRRRGRQIQRTRLMRHGDIEVIMRMLGQCRLGIPGHCDHDVLVVLQEGDQLQDFVGLSRIGNRQNDILRFDHPQIAMVRLTRMKEKRRGTCAGQRRSYFFADQTRFTHAGDDHLAFTGNDRFHGFFKIVGQQFGQVFDGRSLGIDRIDSTLSDRIHLVIGLFFVKSRPRLRSVKKGSDWEIPAASGPD
mgnify:CR=1 FL=1